MRHSVRASDRRHGTRPRGVERSWPWASLWQRSLAETEAAMKDGLIYDWNKVGVSGTPPTVYARRRDAAGRIAVAVGPYSDDRSENPHPAPDRRAWDRHGGHRPAGRGAACGARRRAAGARDRRRRVSESKRTAPRARISTTSLRSRTSCIARASPIECCTFIGSSPIRQYTEGWTLDWLLRNTEEAITFAVKEGLEVMYVTEDTTRADPDTLRAIYRCAIQRRCAAGVHCRYGRPRDARGCGGRRQVRGAGDCRYRVRIVGIDWHGHRDRDLAITNSIAALDAGASRIHAAALGIGERVGNTPMDLLLVNLVLMGYMTRDLRKLGEYCAGCVRGVRRAHPRQLPRGRTGCVSHRHGRPCGGGRQSLEKRRHGVDGRGLFGDSRQHGRPRAGDRCRSDVGQVERDLSGSRNAASHPPMRWSNGSFAKRSRRRRC